MKSVISMILIGAATVIAAAQTPLGSSFTYQGRLTDNGQPAEGAYDFVVHAYDSPAGGTALNPLATPHLDVAVTNGAFTIDIDLGADVIVGDAVWLNILVRPASTGNYVALAPRQPLIAAPYAIHAPRTSQWTTVGGRVTNTTAGQFVGVNRATSVGAAECFGLQAPVQSGYGGMYVRTDGATADPFYGHSNGVRSVWTYLDGGTGDWRVNNGGDRLTLTDTGRFGIGTTSPAARLDVNGGGLADAVFATNSGSGRAAQFHLPAGASGNSLYGVTYGTGKAALFESHVANSTPAVSAYKNGGTAIRATGDVEIDGHLRGQCGNSTARLTPIAYARFEALFNPLTVIAASPNVIVTPSSGWAHIYVSDESDPSTWIVLANISFEDPTSAGPLDELEIYFLNSDQSPTIELSTSCYDWPDDICFEPPPGRTFFDVVVYKP